MCFDLGDVKVEKDSGTFNEEEDEDTLVEEDLKLNAARCFSGTHATVRVAEEAVVTSVSCVECVLTWAMSKWRKTVGLSMKRRMKTSSWRKDLRLNAARCFSGTRATVRFSKETVVTSGSRVKRVLTRAISKLTKHIVTFNEEEDGDTLVEEVPQIERCRGEDTLVEEGPQIERGTVFLRDTCHREI